MYIVQPNDNFCIYRFVCYGVSSAKNKRTYYCLSKIMFFFLQSLSYCRFAEFVEGNSHLEDDEILAYESMNHSRGSRLSDDNLLTSDEDELESEYHS